MLDKLWTYFSQDSTWRLRAGFISAHKSTIIKAPDVKFERKLFRRHDICHTISVCWFQTEEPKPVHLGKRLVNHIVKYVFL